MDQDIRERIASLVGADRLPAAMVAFLYAVFGIVWIEVADRAVSRVDPDAAHLGALQTFGGSVFIVGTAVIIYLLLRGALFLRRRALEAEAERERFLATLMRNLPGMVYRRRYEREWTMEYMSFGVGPLTGYGAEEFTVRRSVSWAGILHPEDRERVWREIRSAVEKGRRFRVEYRIRTRGGETRWVWEQGSPVFGSAGELEALEGFVIDVTGVRAAAAERAGPGDAPALLCDPPTVPLGVPAKRVSA